MPLLAIAAVGVAGFALGASSAIAVSDGLKNAVTLAAIAGAGYVAYRWGR